MENQSYEIQQNWMRKFIPIWSAQLFSLLGSNLVQFALIWWITRETGSAALLATATLVAIIPEILLGPFAGALVDRLNRRIVMIVADAAIAFFTLILALLFAFDLIQIWHIFVVLFVRAVGGIFHWPAMRASTSLMVPEKHLPRVAGINQAIQGSMNIVAPPLGALLMTVMPFYQVIAVDVVTAIIAITPLLFIRIPQPIRKEVSQTITPKKIVQDVAEGFRYIRKWRGLLYLTLISAMLNFFLTPASTLSPLMVTEHFKGGVWEMSLVESMIGIGVVAGGITLGIWGGFKNKMTTSLSGVFCAGLGVVLFGIAPAGDFWLGVVSIGFVGFMLPFANGPIDAIIQSKVAPEIQGRVMGTISSICRMMMPLALIISAPAAEIFGIRFWYWVGGILIALIALGAFLVPDIMSLGSVRKDVQAVPIAANSSDTLQRKIQW